MIRVPAFYDSFLNFRSEASYQQLRRTLDSVTELEKTLETRGLNAEIPMPPNLDAWAGQPAPVPFGAESASLAPIPTVEDNSIQASFSAIRSLRQQQQAAQEVFKARKATLAHQHDAVLRQRDAQMSARSSNLLNPLAPQTISARSHHSTEKANN